MDSKEAREAIERRRKKNSPAGFPARHHLPPHLDCPELTAEEKEERKEYIRTRGVETPFMDIVSSMLTHEIEVETCQRELMTLAGELRLALSPQLVDAYDDIMGNVL